MTLKQQNRGIHGGSSLMLSTLVLSNENQACRMWREAPASIGGGGCHNRELLTECEETSLCLSAAKLTD
mgnify:CR=1 FL=1